MTPAPSDARPGAALAQPTEDPVAAARKLVPLLAAHAAETEAGGRIVPENLAALEDAGLLRLLVPRRVGGTQAGMRTAVEVARELARGCGSTAWVAAIYQICGWFTALAGQQAQDEVWAQGPDTRISAVFFPSARSVPAAGEVRVSGSWPWASGCLHADWAYLGIPHVDAEGTRIDQAFALIPTAQLRVEESWHMAGMRGTGSNTLVAEDVFVPEHRIMPVGDLVRGSAGAGSESADDGVYRLPYLPVSAFNLVGPVLGLAQAALDHMTERAPSRSMGYTFYDPEKAGPVIQLPLAYAATLLDTAHLHTYRAADELDEAARTGRELTYTERARVRMDTAYAAARAVEAVRLLCNVNGASSFDDMSPVQRISRDIEVAVRHPGLNLDTAAEVYRRALTGVADDRRPAL